MNIEGYIFMGIIVLVCIIGLGCLISESKEASKRKEKLLIKVIDKIKSGDSSGLEELLKHTHSKRLEDFLLELNK